MTPPDEFLKHAADCEQMAKFARDPQGNATWKRMAERWRRCAEKFTSESLAAHQAMAAKRRQGVAPDWAHHWGLQPGRSAPHWGLQPGRAFELEDLRATDGV